MLVKEPYWFFKKIVPDHLCDHIIKYAYDKFTVKTALTHWDSEEFRQKIERGDPEALKKQYKIRRSSVVWLHDNWVYNLIKPAILTANVNAQWNFTIDGFEQCQFTIYKENNYYDWHQDSVHSQPNERKLSASLFLNDGEDYEEGEFEFKYQDGSNKAEAKTVTINKTAMKKGSLLVFPSFLYHRVKPVKSGTRHSLVIWSRGPKFK